MQYPAEVGVNTYIKVQLSFLDKSVSSRDVFLYLRLTVNCVNSVCLIWYLKYVLYYCLSFEIRSNFEYVDKSQIHVLD